MEDFQGNLLWEETFCLPPVPAIIIPPPLTCQPLRKPGDWLRPAHPAALEAGLAFCHEELSADSCCPQWGKGEGKEASHERPRNVGITGT